MLARPPVAVGSNPSSSSSSLPPPSHPQSGRQLTGKRSHKQTPPSSPPARSPPLPLPLPRGGAALAIPGFLDPGWASARTSGAIKNAACGERRGRIGIRQLGRQSGARSPHQCRIRPAVPRRHAPSELPRGPPLRRPMRVRSRECAAAPAEAAEPEAVSAGARQRGCRSGCRPA